jgi:D-alanyl-D-alanine carboxypeptidase
MNRLALTIAVLSFLVPFAACSARAQTPRTEPATAAPAQEDVARYAEQLLSRHYRADAPGAAVLVARGDTVLFRGARGEADVAGDVPLRPGSVFRIGSVTKQFAAAGLLTLVEGGKVKLDDPLSKYVADFPGGDGISVLQLLNHTSGVKSYTAIPGYVESSIHLDVTTAELIDSFDDEPPDFEPGSNWAYSNSGYVLVGAVIEAASGQPWHACLEAALFEPLGMTHTGYGHGTELVAQQVRGYSYEGDTVVPMKTLSMTQPHAAGALLSSVDDLLTWNRALHEGRVLSEATYAQMIAPVGKAAAAGYGFGIVRGKVRSADALMHGGAIFGFSSSLLYLPGPDITVAVLENDDANDGEDDADTLARRLAAMALGEPYPELKPVAIDAAALQEAEGVYRFDADVTRVLRVVEGQLTAQRSGPRVVLTPIAADDFLYADGFNRLVLERSSDGGIRGMWFFANGDGDGELGVRTQEPLPAAPVGVKLPRSALERLVGTYVNGQLTMTVFLEGEALKGQLAGQPPVSLRAASPTQFDVEEEDASVEFTAGDAPAAQATIRQGGEEVTLDRRAP